MEHRYQSQWALYTDYLDTAKWTKATDHETFEEAKEFAFKTVLAPRGYMARVVDLETDQPLITFRYVLEITDN